MADRYCMHNQLMNDFIDENFEGIRAPFTAGFELTAKCNLNCVHCYAKPDRNHQDFTLDEFKAIFDTLVDRGLLNMALIMWRRRMYFAYGMLYLHT